MAKRLRNWCFTSYDIENFVVPDDFKDFRYCVYQVEECPETKAWHIQGYIEFKRAVNFATVKDLFKDPAIHLEARRGTRTQARAYCMKPETRVPDTQPLEFGKWDGDDERQRTDLNDARKKILEHTSWRAVMQDPELTAVCARYGKWAREIWDTRPLRTDDPGIHLYQWEAEVIGMLEEPVQKRRVIWIWSAESGTGKTTFFDYCSSKYNVLPAGDYANTMYAYDGEGIIWFDLTRSQTGEHVPYHAIEKFSNATIHMSPKYASCRKKIVAHVVVTANIPPDETKLPNRCVIIQANRLAAPNNNSSVDNNEVNDDEVDIAVY